MMYTVKQLSTLAGVTPRTLHHYDSIGLLKPSRVGENGYRYYGEKALLRLQQILFYREMGLPLEQIRHILDRPDFGLLEALQKHRQEMKRRIARLERLIQTVDDTITHLKGNLPMEDKQIFAAFSDEEQEIYAAEAEQLYDPETVRASNRKWQHYSAEQKQQILDEGRQIYVDMLSAMPQGADSPAAQSVVARWQTHMDFFWTPDLEQLVSLVNGYISDPRFKANFDRLDPALAEFMRQAVVIYVSNQKK